MTCNSNKPSEFSSQLELPRKLPYFIRKFAGTLFLIMLAVLTASEGRAQEDQEDKLSVFGTVKMDEGSKRLDGVRVVVYQDGVEFDAIVTDLKGGYEFDLPLRHNYTFSFELEGHGNKRIAVDASGIPLDVKGARNMDLDMSMMPLPPGFDSAIFEDLYGRGEYDANQNTVIFDSNYTVRMRNKVNAELARLERMAGQEEEMREQFEEFVQKGDRSKLAKEWQKAVDFYDSALALFADEDEVISKRQEAQRGLDAANASAADEAAFQALLDDAEASLDRDRLEEARNGFEAASEMRPDAPEPLDGLQRVSDRASELENSSEVDEEYDDLVKDGDIYFDREQWDRAIDKFAEASSLKPNESYPKNRMEEAEIRQADLASQQADIIARTIEYEALVDEANLLFRADDYGAALVKYEAAGSVLPAERFWQQRAEACRERMAEADVKDSGRKDRESEEAEREAALAEERERREQYDALNDAADELFRSNDYAAAVEKYGNASRLFPDERYPKQRMNEAEKRMARSADAASTSAESEPSQGEPEVSDPDADQWAQAEADAQESDDAAAAQREAREAAELAARSEAEQVEAAYAVAIAGADDAFDRADWDGARSRYEKALSIKPTDRYAKSRMDRVEREASRSSEELTGQQMGASQAELDLEREAMERENADQEEEFARKAADFAAQNLSDEAALKAREKADQEDRARKERQRAERLAAQMNVAEDDEVETYYKEALESEALARALEVEDKKAAQNQLISDSEKKAQDRVNRSMMNQKDVLRQDAAMQEKGVNQQEIRRANQDSQVANFESRAAAAKAAGRDQIQQGAEQAQRKESIRSRMRSRRSQDYTLNMPEVQAKKRSLRNLFQGLSKASEDRRSEARVQAESSARKYRRLGDGANARAQERWLDSRRKAKKVSQQMKAREQEARQRAYNERKAAEDILKEVGPREPEDYKLAERDENVAQGVNEESYDIPNGLVIQRTVRNGNLVVRYRKVVTKTGIYYFRGDRSITADTWRRETTVVLD